MQPWRREGDERVMENGRQEGKERAREREGGRERDGGFASLT